MKFFADLHLHSKYSRATSSSLDLEHMYLWAKKKGINVLASGDFTHPLWLNELKTKLIPTGNGLFRLADDLRCNLDQLLPASCAQNTVQFLLQVEISTIYKKFDKVRKVHHVVLVPSFEAADKLVHKLSKIGNLASDGRPILGLDSRNLLEIVLSTDDYSYIIPAHIWTPWFSALGSKSGFDSIEECYGDLSDAIFAVETGLSSDPPMNWQVPSLDRLRLVSCSDAHSPNKIAREATIFNTELSFFGIYNALKTGHGYLGTIEFFPEEGKYHADGHRKCSVRMEPEEAKAHHKICPVCKNNLTIGVLHRVAELATRSRHEAIASPPATAAHFSCLIPLPEILSEICQQGANTQSVVRKYESLVSLFGSELSILQDIPIEDLKQRDNNILAEAITRLRSNQVTCNAGYDGEYGTITLFQPQELQSNFSCLPYKSVPNKKKRYPSAMASKPQTEQPQPPALLQHNNTPSAIQTDAEQEQAINTVDKNLLIVAGPGSGKTRTITHRIASLIVQHNVPACNILAITFTKRAALEMQHRLAELLPLQHHELHIHTFHSLCLEILSKQYEAAGLPENFRVASEHCRLKIIAEKLLIPLPKAHKVAEQISQIKYLNIQQPENIMQLLAQYQNALLAEKYIDFDDLILLTIKVLTENQEICKRYQQQYCYISIDEYQDVDRNQYLIIKLLAAKSKLCAIGDLNQSIYSFRGADPECFQNFSYDFPDSITINLTKNYRSEMHIAVSSAQLLGLPYCKNSNNPSDHIIVHETQNERDEANFIIKTIQQLTGAQDMLATMQHSSNEHQEKSFSDIAILYRTEARANMLINSLNKAGLPYSVHNHKLLSQLQVAEEIMAKIIMAKPTDLTIAIKDLAAQIINNDNKFEIQIALNKMLELASQSQNSLEVFQKEYVLAEQSISASDYHINALSLMTMHASKGLEFDIVFIIGLEEGILPLQQCENVEEEKRLLYVGMTRAKKKLYLTRSAKILRHGTIQLVKPSHFLLNIQNNIVHQSKSLPSRQNIREQLALF